MYLAFSYAYLNVHFYNMPTFIRAVVGGPAGQAMARPVLGPSKQYNIGLEVVINI